MIMKVEKEMKYEAPEVEILEVEVENGFGQSSTEPLRNFKSTKENIYLNLK